MVKFAQLGRDYVTQLENWRLWAKMRDDRPRGYQPLIQYSEKSDEDSEPAKVIHAWDAYDFNDLVQVLPDHAMQRQRAAFLIKYVSRFKRGNRMFYVSSRDSARRHRLLGLSQHVYIRTLDSAEEFIKRAGGLYD